MSEHPNTPDEPDDREGAEASDADADLLQLANRLAEGMPVDWAAEDRRAEESDRRVLAGLMQIAAVEAAHRQAERSFDALTHNEQSGPRMWRHLTILEALGEGQFGTVYRAFDNRLQIDVALKLSPLQPDPSFELSRFLDEARLLAKIRHPHVVRVFDADEAQGRAGIWMDLVRGRTLEDLVKTQRFSASEAIAVGLQLCGALGAVHARGVLHGDIKAHNVIRRDTGEVVLVDFSAGRTLAAPRPGMPDLAGTLVYLAPEVLRGEARSQRSDLYSLGVLLFHLVTGAYPVWAENIESARQIHERGGRRPLRELRSDLPSAFVRAIERATAPDPSQRYASAHAFETDLRAIVRRRRWPAAAVAATVLLAAMPLAWLSLPRQTPAPAETPAAAPGAAAAAAPSAFEIEAAFYREKGSDARERLIAGQPIGVKDELSLSVTTSAPAYLYVVNEDERGEAYLLFPLPELTLRNPLPANREVRVPADYNWQVSSVGGKEHFLVFASRERLSSFEEVFRLLTPAREGGPVRLSPATLEQFRGVGGSPTPTPDKLRGVGGLAKSAVGGLAKTEAGQPPLTARLYILFTQPLSGREAVDGLWVRQLTLDNVGAAR